MTAPSAEGAKGAASADAEGDFASAEARRGLSDRPRRPFGPPLISLYQMKRWQVAVALSAAVTSTDLQGSAPTFQAEPSRKKCATRTPAALREGARGGASLREAASLAPRRSLALAGRGGAVSRRDLNQQAGNRPHLSGGTKPEEVRNPNASRSSGGSAREGLLSEKPPPSHTL